MSAKWPSLMPREKSADLLAQIAQDRRENPEVRRTAALAVVKFDHKRGRNLMIGICNELDAAHWVNISDLPLRPYSRHAANEGAYSQVSWDKLRSKSFYRRSDQHEPAG